MDIRRWSHGHTIIWDPGVAESRPLAVCYDCLCLISLFRTVMSLSYDWDEVFGWIGQDEGYDYSPAGASGYLPRCLNLPLVMDALSDRDQSAFVRFDWPPGLCGQFGRLR